MPLRSWYDNWDEDYFFNIVEKGTTIYTSGSSGVPKAVFQPPTKIIADAHFAVQVQEITNKSTIYTCLSPEKAGGLFAQTIPALLAGATVDLVKFNPFDYVKAVDKYTHTHLTPKQAKGVMLTKGFADLDLSGKTFMCGSEPVTYDIVKAFVNRGARFVCIWGMTEVGVNAIMHIFNNIEEVYATEKTTPPNSTILGNIFNCDWYCDCDNVLYVQGDICAFDGWFKTKDRVIAKDGILFYTGRDGTPVDFNRPRKG